MGRKRIISCLQFIHLAALLLCSDFGFFTGSSVTPDHRTLSLIHQLKDHVSISTRQMDITTPITTVPTSNPSTPSTTSPILNPADSNPIVMNPANPVMTPLATNSPASSTGSWCVASRSVSQSALQAALTTLVAMVARIARHQAGGGCYDPNTVRDHASYAFNGYYQKNPIPTSCNFGGTAVTTSTDPSYGTCQYPSTSTSSSVLNISNSSGSRVFGAGRPITPSTSAAVLPFRVPYYHYILAFVAIILVVS
ncbi:hypothetical protein DH2020_031292 [Rehmannia glutinosa]|uniref:X8 domain-containing protein n=1 Tax=Rehmannia glutinosa TaxID=99300 RepID=A0ABR0VKP8_REHGL